MTAYWHRPCISKIIRHSLAWRAHSLITLTSYQGDLQRKDGLYIKWHPKSSCLFFKLLLTWVLPLVHYFLPKSD